MKSKRTRKRKWNGKTKGVRQEKGREKREKEKGRKGKKSKGKNGS